MLSVRAQYEGHPTCQADGYECDAILTEKAVLPPAARVRAVSGAGTTYSKANAVQCVAATRASSYDDAALAQHLLVTAMSDLAADPSTPNTAKLKALAAGAVAVERADVAQPDRGHGGAGGFVDGHGVGVDQYGVEVLESVADEFATALAGEALAPEARE